MPYVCMPYVCMPYVYVDGFMSMPYMYMPYVYALDPQLCLPVSLSHTPILPRRPPPAARRPPPPPFGTLKTWAHGDAGCLAQGDGRFVR